MGYRRVTVRPAAAAAAAAAASAYTFHSDIVANGMLILIMASAL